MSALIYEIAWVRSLELIFGTTTFAVATVLAAFMGGLACGSYGMGRLAGRWESHHPLRVYALIEVLIAVVGLLIPWMLAGMVPVYQWVWKSTHASFMVFSLVRFALSVLVLLVPTFLMGATLPVVSQYVSREAKLSERRIGLLYTFNTLGAVLGCAAAGLILFRTIGLAKTQWVAVALNLVAAGGAVLLAGWTPRRDSEASSPAANPKAEGPPAVEATLLSRKEAGLLVGIYAVSGFVAMLYEVAWARVLVLALGSSTYACTVMLTTFLLGLALGAYLATRLVTRVSRPLLAAALVQLGIAVTTYVSVFLVEEMPFLYLKVYEALTPKAEGLLTVQFLLAMGLMILPTLGLGAMFPVAIRGLSPSGPQAARLVGWAYALNTVGAIAGSVAAGFWLVPQFGSQRTLLGGIVLNMAAALAALAWIRSGRLASFRPVIGATLAACCVTVFWITPRWDPAILSSGIFRYVGDYLGLDRSRFQERARKISGEVLFFEEGLTCTITVFRNPEITSFLINGKPDASTPSGLRNPFDTNAPSLLMDLPTQMLFGHVPMFFAPKRDQVLVIGLGSGLTAGAALTHPLQRLECIEIEGAAVRGSRYFEQFNRRPLADPRLELVVNDARNHLLVTDRKYDVIISEPSNPWIPGAANLFTREFFETSRAKLEPHGLFCQWIQTYELNPDHFRTILKTFSSVFPEVHMFRVKYDTILIGSESPLPIDVEQWRTRMVPVVREDLARIRIHAVEDLLAYYWIHADEFRPGLESLPLNTDDNMLIEFAAPLVILSGKASAVVSKQTIEQLFDGVTSGAVRQARLPTSEDLADFWARVGEAGLRLQGPDPLVHARHALAVQPHHPRAAAIQGTIAARRGDPAGALVTLEAALALKPDAPELHRALAEVCLQAQKWNDAQAHAERWLAQQPNDPVGLFWLGRSYYHLKEPGRSLATFERIPAGARRLEELKDLPFYLGSLHAQSGLYPEAADQFNAYLRREPAHLEARVQLAEALYRSGRPSEAAVQWQRVAQLNGSKAAQLVRDAQKDWQQGNRERSLQQMEKARDMEPSNTETTLLLARLQAVTGNPAAAANTLEQHLAWYPDRPVAVGYLSELLTAQNRVEEGNLLAARYRALTGKPWEPLEN